MPKKKKQPSELFLSMMEGLHDLKSYIDGDRTAVIVHHFHKPDADAIKQVRSKLGMSQKKFAVSFGFPVDCIKNWESGRRTPDTSAQILLKVIDFAPEIVMQAVNGEKPYAS